MTERSSRQAKEASPIARDSTAGVTEEIEVRGHIVDSLLLAQDPRSHFAHGRLVRDPRMQDRRPSNRPELREDRDPGRDGGNAQRHPRRSGRARRLADSSRGRDNPAGRHRRGVSRGFLQHDQPADAGPAARALGRRAGSGDGLRDRRRARQGKAALHSDEPGRRGNADRGRPCRRAGAAGRTAPGGELVRLHELDGLERKAQVDQREDDRRRDPGDSRRGKKGVAGRRPGDRAHRLGAARRQADQGGLGAGSLRGQCTGHPRSRTGDLRHQPGRLAGSR